MFFESYSQTYFKKRKRSKKKKAEVKLSTYPQAKAG